MAQRYLEMGFSEESAEEALQRFGDDLHAGCHWLMMRETMGRVPKRLKVVSRPTAPVTYMGSTIRYLGMTWAVVEFDARHALIRLARSGFREEACRCEHISDARMEWIQVRHNEPSASIPRASWRRTIGQVKVSFEWIDQDLSEVGPDKDWLNIYIKHGRPMDNGLQWTLWRSIARLNREFVHEPNRAKPRGLNSTDVHNFCVEGISYFNALCDVYGISQNTFSEAFYNQSNEAVLKLFPDTIHEDLLVKLKRQRRPQPFLAKLNLEWRRDCLPSIEFKFKSFDYASCHATFDVVVHDMTFVQRTPYEPAIHRQLQRIFFHIFPSSVPRTLVLGPMDGTFLKDVLTKSRKAYTKSSEPDSAFTGELFPYQKKCLHWLIKRESSDSTSSWGWTRRQLDDGFVYHTSIFGHFALTPPNTSIRGGLLAQDVGMGKTVEMLALIATHKASGPTLVVVPTTMLQVWMTEAADKTPSLKTVKFHGTRRTSNMDELREADIVVTTYNIVVHETKQHVPTIGSVRWGRIILDESHEIKTVGTQRLRAICRLFAPLRWCISATPWPKIMSSVNAMLAFLGLTPFNEAPSLGNYSPAQLFIRFHHEHNPSLFCNMLSELTWWQRKRHVRLTLPLVRTQTLEIENTQVHVYDILLDAVRLRVQIDRMTPGVNSRTRILHYTRWLRQVAVHASLARMCDFAMPSSSNEAPSETNTIDSFIETLGTANYDQSLRDIIRSWRDGNETCSICMDAMDRPTLTPCHHMFCFECIQTSYQHDYHRKCPLCRKPAEGQPLKELTEQEITPSIEQQVWRSQDLQGCPVEMPMEIYLSLQESRKETGDKMQALLDIVSKGKEKCIIFTQFHGAWRKTREILAANNIKYASIEGKMSPAQRGRAIRDFQEDADTKAFIMTTKTASVGITLTAGSHVIFLEPCENEHLRKQAIGRAWRIGQTKTVTVTTLKLKDTVDMIAQKDILRYLNVEQPSNAEQLSASL